MRLLHKLVIVYLLLRYRRRILRYLRLLVFGRRPQLENVSESSQMVDRNVIAHKLEHLLGMEGGLFVHTSYGRTRYRLKGDPNRPLVVLVHGFGVFSFVWDRVLHDLLDKGYQVLCFDLFGSGFSDAPSPHEVHYDVELYISQLREVLDEVCVGNKPFTLMGHSMGGLISSVYASRFPEQVSSLVLVCPAGVRVRKPFNPFSKDFHFYLSVIHGGYAIASLPVIGEYILDFAMACVSTSSRFRSMAKLKRDVSYGTLSDMKLKMKRVDSKMSVREAGTRFIRMLDMNAMGWAFQQQVNPEYAEVIQSTLRNMDLFGDWSSTFRMIEQGPLKHKTLICWGDKDEFIPYKSYQGQLRHYMPSSRFVRFDDCDHFLYLNHPDQFIRVVHDFVQQV